MNAAQRIKDLGARKAYLDRIAARFFTHATTGQKRLDHERRVTGIAAAIIAGDGATAGRLLGEVQGNFQRWWETFAAVIDTLAESGKPDLAIATEAKYHRAVNVNLQDALGRRLGTEVWTRSNRWRTHSCIALAVPIHCRWCWRCQSRATA